jgi:acetyl esterase/lipase
MKKRSLLQVILFSMLVSLVGTGLGEEPSQLIRVWPDFAPGETTKSPGEALPRRLNENPPATRITKITAPQLEVYAASKETASGAAVLICPGGAYNYVVRDNEGSEAAEWLNSHGVTAFVLRYRTKDGTEPIWKRPLQDAQRSLSLIRSRASEWSLDTKKIGIIGFSAGGQVAALTATNHAKRTYDPLDAIDKQPCRADFAMLIYPWRLANEQQLMEQLTVDKSTPPTFLVHAHNDNSSSLSSILFYLALKTHRVDAELHIYRSGGHGYGLRPVDGSHVSTWPARAADWLESSGWLDVSRTR